MKESFAIRDVSVYNTPFGWLPGHIINSKGLDISELGFLLYLINLPPNFKIYFSRLPAMRGIPKHSVRRWVKALKAKGYIISRRVAGTSGRFSGWVHYIYATPQLISPTLLENDIIKDTISSESHFPTIGQIDVIQDTNEIGN